MRRSDDVRAWVAIGVLGSILLGIAMIPLRTLTSASNLAFAFLVLTIVVAEVGGRSAALATAVVSAMSLDFFLTEPYLQLTMSKPDDAVAFAALAVCGLIAAAFGRRRERWSEQAGRAEEELGVLKKLVEGLEEGASVDHLLEGLREGLGLGAIVLRGDDGRVLAAAPFDAVPAPAPQSRLHPDTLLPFDDSRLRFGTRGLRLPAGGGRIQLRGRDGKSPLLDVWEGDTGGLGVYETRALTIAAALIGLELSRGQAR